ncbi:MAG: molybdate ABC transporter permease subunit [Alphaproteobacteria bacterium]|nr:molybdate ABC transporter permease subunit [Alphaproteobacteria bacterium]
MLNFTPVEIDALYLTLKVALFSIAICLPTGILVAFILSRISFPGKWLLDGIVHLPLVMPPVVVGYLLLILLGKRGVIGEWLYETFNITVAFSWTGAAIASAVMAFPLMVRAVRLSIDSIDQGLESAASTLGANRLRILLTITLPLSLPGIIAGTILAFARSLGEFGATITFVSNIPGETQTLPLALYNFTQLPGDQTPAIRLLLISLVLAFSALIASDVLARRVNKRLGVNNGGAR